MLDIPSELFEHLERGGSIVVPSQQRAAALRLAHTVAVLASGRRVWHSPDVLPWSAWVERSLDQARARGEPLPARLSAFEEWLLWREAVHQACSAVQILLPDALLDSVRRAISLVDDYGLTLTEPASPEAAVLLQARAHFRRRCGELQVLGSGSWQDCARFLRPSAQLLLAGFTALGPARQHWLQSHGAQLWDGAHAPARSGASQSIGFDSAAQEAEAAAQWCAAQLQRDPRARVLLVVPRLAEQRHQWQRALSQRLDYAGILSTTPAPPASGYALEGGVMLADYPVVAIALQLFTLAAGQGDFQQLSAVLRTPYLGALDRHQCLRIELWLRERNLDVLVFAQLQALLPALSTSLGEPAASTCQQLIASAMSLADEPRGAPPALWAQRLVRALQQLGWPGRRSLSSAEQQIRARFDELLGDFAAIALGVGALSLPEAAQLLLQLARRSAFEPASDDVPVTLSASLDDPIVHYDGVWVAGLAADTWPPPARPDPLIPLQLQRAAAISNASAPGQLQRALQAQQHWQRSSAQCVLSWSRSEADLARDMSPLLRERSPGSSASLGDAAANVSLLAATSLGGFQLERWLAGQAPVLEIWRDSVGPAWPREQPLRGGARLLELQSLCAFRAFAELRLRARPLPLPAPGIDARLRGQMLHRALELFWRSTGDWATLRARTADANLALARGCIARAIEQVAAQVSATLEPTLLRREAARSELLLARLIDWELLRAPFETQLLEDSQPLRLAGAVLELRLDRLDRLDDGRLVVIDYKSGAAASFEPFAQRPPQPQLPAYAMLAGDEACAVAALHLGRDGLKLRGVADRSDRIHGISALSGASWPQLLGHWQQELQTLMQEFLDGQAQVQPQAHACDYCHLQLLCRIEPGAAFSASMAPAEAAVEAASAGFAVSAPT